MAVVIGDAAVAVRAETSQFGGDAEGGILGKLTEIGGKGAQLLGGLLGGAALASAFMDSLEREALGDKLAAQLGSTPQEAEKYGQIAGDLYADAYGDSLGTVNDALRSVVQNVGGMADASQADLQAVTASVMDLSTAFDQDVGATSQAVGRMIQTGMAANAQEALDVLTRGFQEGADRGGDFLDVIGEYGTTFGELGLQGPASVGLINQALAAGIPNADFAADALREIGIRGREGSEEAATALGNLGLNANEIFAGFREGGPAASSALDTVLDALRNTEDPALRASAATALVGTQYEDLGDAILSLDPSAATDALGQVEGAAANMGTTLNDNAATALTSFTRGVQDVAVNALGGLVLAVQDGVTWLNDHFGPALDAVRAFIEEEIGPVFEDFKTWLDENNGLLEGIATTITVVLLPALSRLAISALISGATTAAGWAMSAAGAIGTGIVYVAQSALIVARWVAMGIAAVINGGLTVGAWIGMGIAAAVNAAMIAGAWLGQTIATTAQVLLRWVITAASVAASWAVMAIQATVRAVAIGAVWLAQTLLTTARIIASWAIAVATVVAGWVVMGVQAMLQAARMAAAWLIAMGPVGWVIAAVVGLVALIIANWDKVKTWTVNAFNAVVDKVKGAFTTVKTAVSTGISNVVSFFSSLPGRILSALGNLGSLLLGAGGDLIRGLVNGISGAASFVGDVAGNIWNAVKGFINRNVIGRLNSLLEFTIAGITVNPPDIPMLHSGGEFYAPGGEGLALLRSGELVVTPEQRAAAARLSPDAVGAGTTIVGGTTVSVEVNAAPGMSVTELSAHVAADLGWQLATGATTPLPALPGARP